MPNDLSHGSILERYRVKVVNKVKTMMSFTNLRHISLTKKKRGALFVPAVPASFMSS